MSENIYVFHALPGMEEPVLAGLFQYDSPGVPGKFRYVRSYLDRADALPISPVDLASLAPLTVHAGERNDGVFGVFRDTLPDFWGRLVYASNNGIPPETVTNIMLMRRPDPLRIGAIDFSNENQVPKLKAIMETHDMSRLVSAAQEILDGNEGMVSLDERRLLLQGSSMGGARPKANVLHNGRLYLAKFPVKGDRFDNARVEMAISDLARSAGIETPKTELIPMPDGRGVFLSERFDRVPVPEKPGIFYRKGFLSALTLLGLDEMENPLGSYTAIADAARRIGIDCGSDLFRRMSFNISIRNTDDHLRNHGFIREGRDWRLSPAYDLMPTPSIPGVGTFFDLSIGIGKMGRKATLENALSEAARFGLDQQEAEVIFLSVAEKVGEWRSFMSKHGVSNPDIEKFAGSFLFSGGKSAQEDITSDS